MFSTCGRELPLILTQKIICMQVILLDREETDWIRSVVNHFNIQNKFKFLLLTRIVSPTGRQYFKFLRNLSK